MNNLFLFLVFLIAGFCVCVALNVILFPLKKLKNKIAIFISDLLTAISFCLAYQTIVTLLNYGIFRVYFLISYLLGIYFAVKLIIQPLEKILSKLYNKAKEGKRLKCNNLKKQL